VDIYMSRNDESIYTFHLDIPIGKSKHRVSSHDPSELKNLLNKIVAEEIEKTWDKGLVVDVETYTNSHRNPEAPGEHELKVTWHVVLYKVIDDYLCYLEDGELFTRTNYVGKKKNSWHQKDDNFHIIPWTQHREDMLCNLGRVLHEANDKLVKLVHEDGMVKALDAATPTSHLLTEHSV